MLKLVAGLALACLVTPAAAADGPACVSVPAFVAYMAAPPAGVIADDVKVKASTFDEAIIYQFQGKEFISFAKAGCIVGPPLYLGDLPGATPTPVDPPPAPHVPDVST